MSDAEFPSWFNPQKLRPVIVAVVFRMLQGYSQSTRDMVVDDALDDVRSSYRPLPNALLGRPAASPETFAYRVARARAIDALRRGPADLAARSDPDQTAPAEAVEPAESLLISASSARTLFAQVFTQLQHPPFQLITFTAHRLLDYSLDELAGECANTPLGVLWNQLGGHLVDGYEAVYQFPDEVEKMRRHVATFRGRLGCPVGEGLTSPETLNVYRVRTPGLLERATQDSSLSDYFTVNGDAARRKQAGHWSEAVRRRSVTALVRTATAEAAPGAARPVLQRITSE